MASVMGEMASSADNIKVLQARTLDEPVSATILRDVKMVGIKLKYVLVPRSDQEETLKELRKLQLSFTAPKGQASLVFTAVFFIVWFGAGIVSLNAQLLGGKLSFFQSVCVLGYCIFPLNIAALLCFLWNNKIYRAVVVLAAFGWSTRASLVFMSQLVPEQRRWLALYPALLFYIVIAWMVSVH